MKIIKKNGDELRDVMKIIWRFSRFMSGPCHFRVPKGHPSFAASFVSDVLHRLDAVVEGLIKPTTVAVSLGLFSQNCSYGPKNNYLGGIIMRYNQLVFFGVTPFINV